MDKINKRVKIVATVGPASTTPEDISSRIESGVNVFRINFSHGDLSTHTEAIKIIREESKKLDCEVAILADLQGPKIRTRKTPDNSAIYINKGEKVVITSQDVLCSKKIIAIDYEKLYKEIDIGQVVMINDGAIQLKIIEKKDNGDFIAEVISGGRFSSHKGVNFPDVDLSIPSLTEKDINDLSFILEQDFQYIALSFVRKSEDVGALKEIVAKKRNDIKIIAKIEKPEAVKRIDSILQVADGIMVARGDLGVEATPFMVPIMQKELIRKANKAGKIVIVATQMLESMIENPLPTRAEATDVANAIIDGADAIMLSGETAVGKYPLLAVETMVKIAAVTEGSKYISQEMINLSLREQYPPHAICEAAVWACRDMNFIPLCVYTISGETALYLAKLRYSGPVFAFSPEIRTVRMLSLAWNIYPLLIRFSDDIVEVQKVGEEILISKGLIRQNDLIGIISGTNALRGATNSFRIKRAGQS
ncbi:MAG: pyruvate kinase [Chitinispirillaceae bacterium]|nr:pyruvate kinase [Chitinispirillaceae bacterium]